jgi:hypothetical protein
LYFFVLAENQVICKNLFKLAVVSCFNQRILHNKKRLTKRAPDVWDSAAFSSIFLASSFSCFQAESTPAHTQVTQTVSHLVENNIGRQNIVLSLSKDD